MKVCQIFAISSCVWYSLDEATRKLFTITVGLEMVKILILANEHHNGDNAKKIELLVANAMYKWVHYLDGRDSNISLKVLAGYTKSD